MFICQPCHDKPSHNCKNGFVEGLMRSRGPCEDCGIVSNCLDCHGYKYIDPEDDRDELREQILLDKHDMEAALTEDSRIDPNPGGPDHKWATFDEGDDPKVRFINGTGDTVTCGAFLSLHHPVRRATGQQECLCLIPTADLPKACPQCGQWKS